VSLYSCKKEIDNPHLNLNKIVFGDSEASDMNSIIYNPPVNCKFKIINFSQL